MAEIRFVRLRNGCEVVEMTLTWWDLYKASADALYAIRACQEALDRAPSNEQALATVHSLLATLASVPHYLRKVYPQEDYRLACLHAMVVEVLERAQKVAEELTLFSPPFGWMSCAEARYKLRKAAPPEQASLLLTQMREQAFLASLPAERFDR